MGIGTERGDPFGGGVPGDPGTQASERGAGGWGFDEGGEFGLSGRSYMEQLLEDLKSQDPNDRHRAALVLAGLERERALAKAQASAAPQYPDDISLNTLAEQAGSAIDPGAKGADVGLTYDQVLNRGQVADEIAHGRSGLKWNPETQEWEKTIGRRLLEVLTTAIGLKAPVDAIMTALEDYNLTEETKEKIVAEIEQDPSPEKAREVTDSLTAADFESGSPGQEQYAKETGTAPVASPATTSDPTTLDFWSSFVKEFANAKKMYQQDDAFKKAQVQPAMQKYRDRLQGVSGEALHQPITWGMGDFRSTFMPKSSQGLAQSVLGSELAETEVMRPNAANLAYLDQLFEVAKTDRSLAQNLAIANIQNPRDKGSWLDTIADIVRIGGDVSDIWESTGR